MSRSDEPDNQSRDRFELSGWDIKELNLASSDPILQSALPLLMEDSSFVKWLSLLKKNDKRASKFFVLETPQGWVTIGIGSFFSEPTTKLLHLHLVIRFGRLSLEEWVKDRGNSET